MTHRPISSSDRDSLIAQAYSSARCWFVVCAGLLLIILLGGFQGA